MATDQTRSTGYISKLPEVTENGILNTGWPNFRVTSMATHYSTARLFAWVSQALLPIGAKLIDERILKHKVMSGVDGDPVTTPAARKYFLIFETVGFSLISLTSFFLEKANLKHQVYDAMAAERGMNPEKVSIFTMFKSHNPFIRSLRDRFSLENALRIPASLLFAHSLPAGIMAMGADFMFERSVLVENSAFDVLHNMLFEVQQLKTSGPDDTQRVYIGLQRAVQRSLTDNHRKILSETQLVANKAVFDRLSGNIIADRFHINETIYILGEMANHPENTNKLLADIDKMEQVGIKGFARQKALLANGKAPADKTLEQGKRPFAQMSAGAATSLPGVV